MLLQALTQPLVAQQDCRTVQAECSLYTSVLVQRREGNGETAQPLIFYSLVDLRTSLSLVFQDINPYFIKEVLK